MNGVAVNTASALDTRVLVLTPTTKDYALLETIFKRHAIAAQSCPSLETACDELARGAGALLVAEEALAHSSALDTWLQRQPPWSDLPILVMARPGMDSNVAATAAHHLGNVTILDRPTRVANLVTAVQSALRARKRQYQIREHLAEQKRTQEQLRADDQRKDEFLAILAHELRNPLAPISNGLQILNLMYRDDERTAAVRQVIGRQIDNMKRLVDDLLEVSRVTRGQLDLRIEQAELGQIVRSAIDVSEPLIKAAEHRLEVELPDTPVYLRADVVRLAQVISNLLNNAAKYTRSGGVIRLAVTRTDDEIVIRVTDNGIGIPPDMQPKIFDMFMQVDASRNRSQGGLGIGLTLVKRLVELHGGSIAVCSEGIGKGSSFVVRLPVRTTTEPASVAGKLDASTDLSGLTVLITDDNRDAGDTLGDVLRRLGASVKVAYSGTEALAVLARGWTDVAILDIGMPDLDGMAVARRIRTQDGGSGPVLVALTGWGQHQDVVNTRDAGFDHHLTKPVEISHLVHLLQNSILNRPATKTPK